jgi:hypothetical protein
MAKVSVTYTVTYNLSPKSSVGREYLEWLEDDKNTKSSRKWFVIDRLIGHHNLALFDSKAKLTVTEED